MFSWIFGKKPSLEQMTSELPRAEVLRRGRVLVLDDQEPEMLADLKRQGLAIDHWSSTAGSNFHLLESGHYDVLLLDYGGIGKNFGPDEGLDVLRHLKRVNPALKIVAFTARTFDASKADFFRLSDDVIRKDAGIRETLEQLESQLAQSLTPAAYFKAVCATLSVEPGTDDAKKIESLILKASESPKKRPQLLEAIKATGSAAANSAVEGLVGKAIELVVASMSSST